MDEGAPRPISRCVSGQNDGTAALCARAGVGSTGGAPTIQLRVALTASQAARSSASGTEVEKSVCILTQLARKDATGSQGEERTTVLPTAEE